MRAQDRWNKKAGYISKSYKVNQNIADDFASSCKEMGVSQSGELLKFMSEFIKKNLKGEKKMRVMTKYTQDGECAGMVEMAINQVVYQYDNTEIENEEKRILKECEQMGKGGRWDNCLDFKKDFDVPNARETVSLEDFCEIGRYVKSIYLRDVALMRLVIEKKLMPVRIRYSNEMELNINYSHGNMIFTLQMDLFPFDVYVVI